MLGSQTQKVLTHSAIQVVVPGDERQPMRVRVAIENANQCGKRRTL